MDIKPIKTRADYEAALAEIDRLFDAEPGSKKADRLEVLVTLVEKYEDEREPIPPPDPIAAIEYYLESRGLTRKDLEALLGTRGRVSEILNRKRPLTLGMIRMLHKKLGIPADVLIKDYAAS